MFPGEHARAAVLWRPSDLRPFSTPLAAQTAERERGNPRLLAPEAQGVPAAEKLVLAAVPTAPGVAGHESVLDLDVVYTDGQIFNPATGLYDKVRLRSYNGTDVSPTTPYVSPTIEVNAGRHDPGQSQQQAAAGSELRADDRAHAQQAALLQRHQPPHARPVGESVGQWRQCAAARSTPASASSMNTTFRATIRRGPSGTIPTATARPRFRCRAAWRGALIVRGDRLPHRGRAWRYRHAGEGHARARDGDAADPICLPRARQGRKPGPIKLNKDGTYRCDLGDVGKIEAIVTCSAGANGARPGATPRINGVVLPSFPREAGPDRALAHDPCPGCTTRSA